jgi:DNA-binding LacI/PurR family transcriptional regulator
VEKRARELGFGLESFYPLQQPVSPQRLTQILKSRGIPGAVITAANFASSGYVHPLEREHLLVQIEELASASLGGYYENPALHFASNDQYAAGRKMAMNVERLGYRRPGLVIDPYADFVTESRFQAGFLSLKSFVGGSTAVPLLVAGPREELRWVPWFQEHRPDVVVASFPVVMEWMRRLGLRVPEEVGFATFDVDSGRAELSGIDQQHEEVAASAVEMVVQQINLNAWGAPRFARGSEIKGSWVAGRTLRNPG